MKKYVFTSGVLALLFALLAPSTACWYDNDEQLYGYTGGCDTTDMSYSQEIQTILVNNCYACHSTTSPGVVDVFDSYEQLKIYADNGKLLSSIRDIANPMPPTGLMSECNINRIEAWVKAGAPDN
jgi:hypothetical protein